MLARENPKAVNFGITNAVIGLRGTGFDGYLGEHCPDGQACAPTAFNSTWQNGTEFRVADQTLPVDVGQTGIYMPSTGLLTHLDTPPGAGLHLGMRGVGETVLQGPGGSIYLAGEEGGWLPAGQDVPMRTRPNWASIMNSDLPAPESFDERTTRVLELLNPGDVICEIR